MAPRTWNVFRTLLDGQDRYQLQPDPTTESRRSLSACRFMFPGRFQSRKPSARRRVLLDRRTRHEQIVIGRRSEVYVSYLGERYAEYDQTAIRTTSRWAIAPINEEGVELITGVRCLGRKVPANFRLRLGARSRLSRTRGKPSRGIFHSGITYAYASQRRSQDGLDRRAPALGYRDNRSGSERHGRKHQCNSYSKTEGVSRQSPPRVPARA